jgi:hypothetical protein
MEKAHISASQPVSRRISASACNARVWWSQRGASAARSAACSTIGGTSSGTRGVAGQRAAELGRDREPAVLRDDRPAARPDDDRCHEYHVGVEDDGQTVAAAVGMCRHPGVERMGPVGRRVGGLQRDGLAQHRDRPGLARHPVAEAQQVGLPLQVRRAVDADERHRRIRGRRPAPPGPPHVA